MGQIADSSYVFAMIDLLFHRTSDPSGTSPFDKAIVRVTREGAIRIVSPYIAISYLQRIVRLSSEWRLISDVEEWLFALSVHARPRAWQFIRENIQRIHHCRRVHAKAVIGTTSAVLGTLSAASSILHSAATLPSASSRCGVATSSARRWYVQGSDLSDMLSHQFTEACHGKHRWLSPWCSH